MATEDFLRHLDLVCEGEFADDPYPGWAGISTMFSAPFANRGATDDCDYIVAGVPFDGTASSRPGSAEGPNAIRTASRVYASSLDSLGLHEMLDTRTSEVFRYRKPKIVDIGDLHVYPSNVVRTYQSLVTEVQSLAQSPAKLLFLGGDHSIAFPLFTGVMRARTAREANSAIGYIQIDHHFDFGNHSVIHGPVYHGSNARRISELPGMTPQQIGFVGVGDVTRKDQFDALKSRGFHIVTAATIKELGVAAAIAPMVDDFLRRCSSVYISIDIDVLNAADAPGTGNVTIGGLDTATLMDLVLAVGQLPWIATDFVEVAPRYDLTGRTAQLAARVWFELIHRQRLTE